MGDVHQVAQVFHGLLEDQSVPVLHRRPVAYAQTQDEPPARDLGESGGGHGRHCRSGIQ